MAKDEKPEDYKGPRTPIQMKNPCGFCNASDHHMCKHELPYYEKLWICGCDCNKGWKPIDLGGEPSKRKRVKDEVRVMQLPSESGSNADADTSSGNSLFEPSSEASPGSVEELGVDSDPDGSRTSSGEEVQEED